MKKTYSIPKTIITAIAPARLIAESFTKGQETFNSSSMKYVKEDNVSSSSRYNVWDDDWSD